MDDYSDSSSLKGSLLGKLVLSSGLLDLAWSKIPKPDGSTYADKDSALGVEIKYYTEGECTIVVFVAPPISRKGSFYSASTLLSGSSDVNPFHFLCSDIISSFSVHTPAFQLFSGVNNGELKSKLLDMMKCKKRIIITGAGLGGSVASLYTLWLSETTGPRISRPLCITFGSPLLGDASLQQILENSVWGSHFLHVADAAQSPIVAGFFKPFGTFLISFGSKFICINDPEAVIELLFSVNADVADWRDYGEVLRRMDQPVLSTADSRPVSLSDDVIDRMEDRAAKKKLLYDLIRRQREMQILMMNIDCYIKICEMSKLSSYDQFKTQHVVPFSLLDIGVAKCKRELHDYWKLVAEEMENMPQSERIIQRKLIYSGNNYIRKIEPFDIAEYYLSGGKEYRTLGRSHHYLLLEKFFKESFSPYVNRRLNSIIDTCFWAEVEEAMIAINFLKIHMRMRDEEREVLMGKVARFEDYVWEMIDSFQVSPEIFLENSSFMRWWKEYTEIKGRDGFNSSPSHLTEFMNTGKYEYYGQVDISDSKEMDDSLAYVGIQGTTPLVAPILNKDEQCPTTVVVGKDSIPIITEAVKEMAKEAECVVVFSCDEYLDVEETSFIKAIVKELHEREVTPLTYNFSGRENLNEEILNRSSVGIMVLSNSFFGNIQSLDHLLAIMEHGKATNLVIIPIYFKVTRAEICGYKGLFEAAVLRYLTSIKADRVQRWKTTITEITSNSGHEWTKGTQFKLAEEVVGNACLRLYLKNSENMVRILALLKHSQSQPSDADFVGIWGMAGIGKTAITREVYEILASQYDLCYFRQDFFRSVKTKGLRQMRDDFFSEVFADKELSISARDTKPSFMKNWFQDKKILVFLDDVRNARDVEAVLGGFGWFSRGHRIILTSRRKQVLVQCKVREPYEVQKLCEIESLRLCKRYLNEERVISELMSCSSGIPLALEVLATSISNSKLHHTKDMLERLQTLRRHPPTELQKTFRRSFKGLNENEKNIFLDLACFFGGGTMDHLVQLLDACGFRTYLGICGLIDESLISLVDNRIEMPIPFQDIGQFIVREEDEDPCERSRLWDSKDIISVFTNGSGTDATEGIFLDMSDLTCELSPSVFCEMYRLRLLKFYCSTSGKECKLSLPKGLDSLPDELRLLHWENYPLEYLPQKFNPKNLVELNMPYSNMEKLWEGKKNLEKLKKIKLSHSKNLTDILMLSEALNLEHIDLEGCTSLVDVSKSIPRCGKLVSLNMKDCLRLQSVPAMVVLISLKLLNLSGCSELEKIQDFAPNLEELYLAGTAITELPLSIGNLTELVTLDLENCKRLQQLPFGMKNSRSIVDLKLSGCTSLESLPKPKALD